MTDFLACSDCSALTLDTDEDAARHRLWHRDFIAKYEGVRGVANAAKNALGGLRADVKHYGEQLAARPITVEPEQLRVREMPTDEQLGLPPEEPVDETDPDEPADDLERDLSRPAENDLEVGSAEDPASYPGAALYTPGGISS